MTLWAEDFKRWYPNVNIQIQAAGSSTAPPALTEGTSQLGPMSRKMKDKELEGFESKYGYKPLAIKVAIDALAVYVHKDNPIEGLSMRQVDAIFSSTNACGFESDITKWADLGVEGSMADKDIQLYGRNSVSGTYGYFKETALCKGDYKKNVNEQPGSASVVQSVSQSLNAVGYSGIGYKTSGVRAVPLAKGRDNNFVEASAENAISGSYPLSRFLYVYVNKAPPDRLQEHRDHPDQQCGQRADYEHDARSGTDAGAGRHRKGAARALAQGVPRRAARPHSGGAVLPALRRDARQHHPPAAQPHQEACRRKSQGRVQLQRRGGETHRFALHRNRERWPHD